MHFILAYTDRRAHIHTGMPSPIFVPTEFGLHIRIVRLTDGKLGVYAPTRIGQSKLFWLLACIWQLAEGVQCVYVFRIDMSFTSWMPLLSVFFILKRFFNQILMHFFVVNIVNSWINSKTHRRKKKMHFHLVVYLLVFSIFLINVVISIEPVTMGIGAAVIGEPMTSYVAFLFT